MITKPNYNHQIGVTIIVKSSIGATVSVQLNKMLQYPSEFLTVEVKTNLGEVIRDLSSPKSGGRQGLLRRILN